MLNRATLPRGFNLIELMITLAIVSIVLALGAPSFFAWIQNTQIRTATESMLTGIKLARAEAAKRNVPVSFQIMTSADASCGPSTAGANWVVSVSDATGLCNVDSSLPPFIIRSKTSGEGTRNVAFVASQAITNFDALGRVTPIPAANIVVNVTNPAGGSCVAASGPMRCMQIQVTPGGQARMCDPAVTAINDSRTC